MTNAFILCDLAWKVHKSHAANREGSFNKTPRHNHLSKFNRYDHKVNNSLWYWNSETVFFPSILYITWPAVAVLVKQIWWRSIQVPLILAIPVGNIYLYTWIQSARLWSAYSRRTHICHALLLCPFSLLQLLTNKNVAIQLAILVYIPNHGMHHLWIDTMNNLKTNQIHLIKDYTIQIMI